MTATVSGLLSSARVVSLPLRNKFRGLLTREMVLFEGPQGWAEFSPFIEYPDLEAVRWLESAIEWAYQPAPSKNRTAVGVNAILADVPVSEIERTLARAGNFQCVKLKVGESGQQEFDLARIRKVSELFPGAKIRLDANGRLDTLGAISLLERLNNEGIALEYFEQPVAGIHEMKKLRQQLENEGLQVLIAADESIRKADDPLEAARVGACDLLVLKVAPLGGISKALAIAKEVRLPVVPSGALQSSIGLAQDLFFAAALDRLDFACGLGTNALFAGDLVKDPLIPIDGQLEVRRPELNTSALETFAAEDHRADWWLARLERCARMLGLEA